MLWWHTVQYVWFAVSLLISVCGSQWILRCRWYVFDRCSRPTACCPVQVPWLWNIHDLFRGWMVYKVPKPGFSFIRFNFVFLCSQSFVTVMYVLHCNHRLVWKTKFFCTSLLIGWWVKWLRVCQWTLKCTISDLVECVMYHFWPGWVCHVLEVYHFWPGWVCHVPFLT